jgi:murein L,D-transpeptidase YafK
LQKTIAQMSPNQIKHNTIVANPVVVGAINAMENLDDCTLWWIVQWGNEYLARFKVSATKKELDTHESYKTWTQQTKQKKDAGFTASVRSAPASAPGSAQKVTPFVDSD